MIETTLQIPPGETYPTLFALFVPNALGHREAEQRAWWYTEAEQTKERSLLTFEHGPRRRTALPVRVTDGELTDAERKHAKHLGTSEIDAPSGPLYLGALEELPRNGRNLRRPDEGFLPFAPARYLVDYYVTDPPARTKRRLCSAIHLESHGVLLVCDTVGRLTAWRPHSLKSVQMPFERKKGVPLTFVSVEGETIGALGEGIHLLRYDTGQLKRVAKRLASLALELGEGMWLLAEGNHLRPYDVRKKQDMKGGLQLASEVVAMVRLSRTVAVCCRGGEVVLFDPAAATHERLEAGIVAIGAAIGLDDRLVLCADDGTVVGIDVQSGRVLWNSNGPSHPSTALWSRDRGTVVVANASGRLAAMDDRAGELLATEQTGRIVQLQALDGYCIVVGEEMLELRSLPELELCKSKRVIRRSPNAVYREDVPEVVLRLRRADGC